MLILKPQAPCPIMGFGTWTFSLQGESLVFRIRDEVNTSGFHTLGLLRDLLLRSSFPVFVDASLIPAATAAGGGGAVGGGGVGVGGVLEVVEAVEVEERGTGSNGQYCHRGSHHPPRRQRPRRRPRHSPGLALVIIVLFLALLCLAVVEREEVLSHKERVTCTSCLSLLLIMFQRTQVS